MIQSKIKAQLQAGYGKPKSESFDFFRIEQFFANRPKEKTNHCISDKTYQDLDFDEVFMFVDRTISKVGQQYLYARLRTIDFVDSKISQHENLTKTFQADSELREDVGIHLSNLSHQNAYYISSLFLKPHLQPPDWFWIVKILPFISAFILFLLPFYPQAFFFLFGVLTINYVIHYWNKNNVYQYIASIPQLLRLNQVAKEILKHERLNPKTDALNQAVNRLDEMGYSMSFFKLESKLQSEVGMIVEVITELLKALFLIEPLLLFRVLNQIDAKRTQIATVFHYVGMIDTALSTASLRKGLTHYCQPVITKTEKKLIATDLYHPLISNPVGNSITLVNKSVLLTGSNMSGKTTFIRTIGINCILAQTIHTCFANEFVLSPMRVFSAIRITDDLLSEKSYYFEEVLTIKAMIDESQSDITSLFLLDELFKGTNTVERVAAGKAVLTYLNKGKHIVFVSTHDIELTDYLKDTFDLYHFTEVVETDKIAFDYKLKKGNLKTRNAIRILELNGYPGEVIREARSLSEKIAPASH
ncbi:MutS family DNA mismatch repair protein [Larkinella knui]|uniref:DNA mismatch repair protein MutS n=1 Tax=Larkinella knui TaxID=2025310 RepID=A0A3P1CBL4_9BACT|nr:DNA mismatch repair protein MutS [Larkinella knui]RRB10620.1 DNA mismatch repair protein MutS [Larkinella knui]